MTATDRRVIRLLDAAARDVDEQCQQALAAGDGERLMALNDASQAVHRAGVALRLLAPI